MVEELAKWKSALSNRIHDLQEAIRNLIRDLRKVNDISLKTHTNLKDVSCHFISDEKENTEIDFKNKNVIDIAVLNETLSKKLIQHLKIKTHDVMKTKNKLVGLTVSEKSAEMVNIKIYLFHISYS